MGYVEHAGHAGTARFWLLAVLCLTLLLGATSVASGAPVSAAAGIRRHHPQRLLCAGSWVLLLLGFGADASQQRGKCAYASARDDQK